MSGVDTCAGPVFRSGAVRVRVPATSANLGPGYDTLGLALDWHDEVQARIGTEGLQVAIDGEGVAVSRDESHLVVRTMRTTFARLGGQPHGLELSCTNRVPHGRGLGSSAAAIVAGVLLARGLVEGGAAALADEAAFALAAQIEGHPDNVAACFYGGLTIARVGVDGAGAVRARVTADLHPVVLVPPHESSTASARGLLPAVVPHADAAFNAGRTGLLVAVLTGAVPLTRQTLLVATEDRLHQGYRAPGMVHTADIVDELRANGLAAVVSGAGPSVLVLARDDLEVEQIHEYAPAGWRCVPAAVDPDGALVTHVL